MEQLSNSQNRNVMSLLEAIGAAAIRVEQKQSELNQLTRHASEFAMKLRLIADCLDPEQPEKISGLMEGRKFVASDYKKAYSSILVSSKDHPHAQNVFEIPNETKSLMKRLYDTQQLLFSYKDSLLSLLHNALNQTDVRT